MKGRINEDGALLIQRGSKFKLQDCLQKSGLCTDRCAGFGEPIPAVDTHVSDDGKCIDTETGKILLGFCYGDLEFDELEDQRE